MIQRRRPESNRCIARSGIDSDSIQPPYRPRPPRQGDESAPGEVRRSQSWSGGRGGRTESALWREPLGTLPDPTQHLSFHHKRARLHRQHPDARRDRRQTKAVAAQQPRLAATLIEDEGPHPVSVLRAPRENMLGLDPLNSHSVRAKADRVAHVGVLELRQHTIDTVHVESEQVLDPVVRVGAAPWGWAHLCQPRPHVSRRRRNLNRARRNAICVLKKLIARQSRPCF